MSIIAWIILGLVAGWIASKIMHGSGSGLVTNLVLGIVGAFVGGILFSAVGGTGVTGFNVWSLIVAVVGAIVVLWIYNAVAGRRRV
ncbi:GlsB/YeaQ/YmgE family stress response membrane protein [Skermanella rosea]|uniref:GlsB/YeaQ/YmgE family stress response membrane protein n=1 Tax=Skermanella rosea TaxID=1817965 RepID=UPI0019328A8A|nr:GlsB/YeaQ/YmgE family stress response membrane protein [Skermanella rosea]UEM06438.1 GlsB/YeaQ/YmgE family stress response membrane protein [Skermanella rosea]